MLKLNSIAMAFKKRPKCVSNGYQIPVMPRVPKSAKGKRSARKKIEDNKLSAIDTLATIAGKILAEEEGFCAPSKTAGVTRTVHSNIQEQLDNERPFKGGVFDQKSRPLIDDDNARICTLVDPIELDRDIPLLVSSDSSLENPAYGEFRKVHHRSFPSVREGMELCIDREDGKNFLGCAHSRYIHSKAFKAHCTEDHRRRKMKSNYRKFDPVSYNDRGLSNDGMEMKPVFCSERLFYKRQKKRKLSNSCSVSPLCGSNRDEVMLDSSVNNVNRVEAASDLLAALNGGTMSSNRRGQSSLHELEGPSVKLSIKSFKIPELLIEMPADATVASLKRTVMEAVTTILGDGLRVGVLLQGEKVRDDNKTLHQAGICYEDKIGSLGFTLEPNTITIPPPHYSHKKPALAASDPQLLNKFQDKGTTEPTNSIESVHEQNSLHSPPYEIASDSKALVPIPVVNPEALSIIPAHKPRRCSNAQRRIRRPFSVSEVDALVQAVEKLGTGRWRDVKLRAFDKSKHRTYVDLKDKWKTLVHTARISPQQRRGEPVPQELLDRVLWANDHWSHQQAQLTGPDHSFLLA